MALFEQITIVGMGLLGGSIGQAVKKRGIAKRVVALIRDKNKRSSVQKAQASDKISTDTARGVANSELVILAMPVTVMEFCAKAIAPHLAEGAIVTDVGSVKGPVVQALEKVLAHKGRFVGAHPMAGSEKSGIQAAQEDLFEKALCILTPTPDTDPDALQRVRQFWNALGARTCLCSAQDHDSVMATVSHLPHLLAACLMHATGTAGEGYEDPLKYIGPSFRDMTRIAASSPELWADILLANRSALNRSTRIYIEQLEAVLDEINRHNRPHLLEYFSKSREIRERI